MRPDQNLCHVDIARPMSQAGAKAFANPYASSPLFLIVIVRRDPSRKNLAETSKILLLTTDRADSVMNRNTLRRERSWFECVRLSQQRQFLAHSPTLVR